jgi:anti-sigma factor ChrR (cupin superfamily)
MNPSANVPACERTELVCAFAMQMLEPQQAAVLESHIPTCEHCRRELATLKPAVDALLAWPADVLRPVSPLEVQLARRIAAETGGQVVLPAARLWTEPEWRDVAPGISCKLLATDEERRRVSMLVRLAPGAEYPPHTHSGVEELHLLDGELWIDERKLFPGDYNRGEPDTGDRRVWSETGCTCVLVTSLDDVLD